ncbi:MFS transporter [Demetria terragena]|uniref:MFS transporter n=1 Tax=Demetria terragena TaxID=63959 RepID=UPI0003753555|nr:MFS transporter [Demetria terragena]
MTTRPSSSAEMSASPAAGTDQPAGGRSTNRAWGVTIAVTAFMAINFADKSVIGLAADPLREELDLTASQFGLAGSVFFLLFGVFGIIGGFIGNRVRPTRILMVMAVAWGAALLPLVLLPSFATLLFSRIILGAAEGPALPLGIHTVHKWFPESRRPVPTSMVLVGASLGVGISAPVLGYVISAHGWRAAIWILVGLSVVWAAVWTFVGKEGPFDTYGAADDLDNDDHDHDDHDTEAVAAEELHIPYRRILASSAWWGSLLSIGPGFCAFALFSVWAPSYFSQGYGFSSTLVGAAVGATAVCAIIFQLGTGVLSARLVRDGVDTRWARGGLAGAAVLAGGLCLTVGMLLGFSPVGAGLLVLGVALCNSTNPISFLSISEISPVKQRSAIMAIYNSVMTTGGAAAPLVAGLLVDRAATEADGYRQAFLLFGVIAIVGGLIGAVVTNPSRDARRLGLRTSAT